MEMTEKKPKPTTTKKRVKRETISRERVRQIQESALGKLRKLLYTRGLTSMKDFL
jgi:DNA-directed RNA polymerase sigma subunit (sigma70/sigma32)